MKFTYRDCCWLFGGMLIGISLIFLWLYVGIIGALNSIPADSINIEVDFNETELVESSFNWMNKTGQLEKEVLPVLTSDIVYCDSLMPTIDNRFFDDYQCMIYNNSAYRGLRINKEGYVIGIIE